MDHKVIDIDHYIPFNSIEDILKFCSDDGILDLKKAAFRKRIYASGKRQDVSVFAPSIIDAFFDGSPLLGTHKWPYKKLVNKHINFSTFLKPFFFLFLRGYTPSENVQEPFIPFELHNMFETALLTLAGSEKIPLDFCGDEVFRKIRQKFNNAIGHQKAKQVISQISASSIFGNFKSLITLVFHKYS